VSNASEASGRHAGRGGSGGRSAPGRRTEERPTLFSGSTASAQRAGNHAGKALARTLRAHGVDVIFALCGGHVLPILDGCIEAGIRIVDARHEEAAVMMAAAYAISTRKVGVAAITAGPGFTNAVTGIADAHHSGVPVVVLGGRTPLRSWKRDAIQDVDQLAIARVVTKRATLCLSAERVGEYVADAIWYAMSPRAGACYVELPTDVLLDEPRDALGWEPGFPSTVEPAASSVAELASMLDAAERPVLICGSGAFWSGADEALARFSDRTKVPITTTGPARGLLPDSHPGSLGGLAHGGVAVALSDLVVIAGSRFDGNLLFGGSPLFQPRQKIVQIDVRREAFGGNRAPDLAVLGDVATVLDAIDLPPKDAWLAEARTYADASRKAWSDESDTAVDGVHPGSLARAVDAAAPRERTLVCDGGDILTWGIAHLTAERPGSILTTGTALGTLGVGVPFAVGAKAARPNDTVICLTGDGAFGLCAMEVDTSARLGLPVVVVVSNNGAWADVQHEQSAWFGEDRMVGSGLSFTRYEKLAEMVGGFGAYVERSEDVQPAIEEAIASGKTSVVNVRTDPKVVSEILRGIGQLGVM
jgi:acetolactate synthase-1/2/3 large subunit